MGFAASGRNGGQIHTGHRKDTSRARNAGWGRSMRAICGILCEEAKALVRHDVREHGIDCDLKGGLVIAAHNKRSDSGTRRRDRTIWRTNYGYGHARMMDAEETAKQLGTTTYPAARFDTGGGHLHPLNYARGLAAAAEASRRAHLRTFARAGSRRGSRRRECPLRGRNGHRRSGAARHRRVQRRDRAATREIYRAMSKVSSPPPRRWARN